MFDYHRHAKLQLEELDVANMELLRQNSVSDLSQNLDNTLTTEANLQSKVMNSMIIIKFIQDMYSSTVHKWNTRTKFLNLTCH